MPTYKSLVPAICGVLISIPVAAQKPISVDGAFQRHIEERSSQYGRTNVSKKFADTLAKDFGSDTKWSIGDYVGCGLLATKVCIKLTKNPIPAVVCTAAVTIGCSLAITRTLRKMAEFNSDDPRLRDKLESNYSSSEDAYIANTVNKVRMCREQQNSCSNSEESFKEINRFLKPELANRLLSKQQQALEGNQSTSTVTDNELIKSAASLDAAHDMLEAVDASSDQTTDQVIQALEVLEDQTNDRKQDVSDVVDSANQIVGDDDQEAQLQFVGEIDKFEKNSFLSQEEFRLGAEYALATTNLALSLSRELGLNDEATKALSKVGQAAQAGIAVADVLASAAPGPLQAIQIANIGMTLLGENGGPDPTLEYLQAISQQLKVIDEKLDIIDAKVDTMLENQQTIIAGLLVIDEKLTELGYQISDQTNTISFGLQTIRRQLVESEREGWNRCSEIGDEIDMAIEKVTSGSGIESLHIYDRKAQIEIQDHWIPDLDRELDQDRITNSIVACRSAITSVNNPFRNSVDPTYLLRQAPANPALGISPDATDAASWEAYLTFIDQVYRDYLALVLSYGGARAASAVNSDQGLTDEEKANLIDLLGRGRIEPVEPFFRNLSDIGTRSLFSVATYRDLEAARRLSDADIREISENLTRSELQSNLVNILNLRSVIADSKLALATTPYLFEIEKCKWWNLGCSNSAYIYKNLDMERSQESILNLLSLAAAQRRLTEGGLALFVLSAVLQANLPETHPHQILLNNLMTHFPELRENLLRMSVYIQFKNDQNGNIAYKIGWLGEDPVYFQRLISKNHEFRKVETAWQIKINDNWHSMPPLEEVMRGQLMVSKTLAQIEQLRDDYIVRLSVYEQN